MIGNETPRDVTPETHDEALDWSVVDIPILTDVLEPHPQRDSGKPDQDRQQPL